MHKSNRPPLRKMDEEVNSWSLHQWLWQSVGQASHLHVVTSFQQMGIVWLEQHSGKCHFKAALSHAFELRCQIPFMLSLHSPIIQIRLGCGNAGLTLGVPLTAVPSSWKMLDLNGCKRGSTGTVPPEVVGMQTGTCSSCSFSVHLERDGI